jgi:hypothetical protein
MKIEDNRALVAKKKLYNQPEVQVAHIAITSIICTSGSGGGGSSSMSFSEGTTDVQL